MGQYYIICNLDRKEYLHPHRFGDGLKLLEFGNSSSGTMTALAVLLSDGNGRGGGDLRIDEQSSAASVVGSWAGGRIVVAGDYADGGKWIEGATKKQLQAVADEYYTEGHRNPDDVTLYAWASRYFKDVSLLALQAMLADVYIREKMQRLAWMPVPATATQFTPLHWNEEQHCLEVGPSTEKPVANVT